LGLWQRSSMFVLRLLFSAVLLTTGPVFAQEAGRLDILQRSGALSRVASGSDWDVQTTDRAVRYTCKTCQGDVSALLEVWALKEGYALDVARKAYLTERRDMCAALAVGRSGRCVSTEDVSLRGGSLIGFRSSHVEDGVSVVETVVFYRDPQWGSEVIRTVLYEADDARVPADTDAMLRSHMLRLTLFW